MRKHFVFPVCMFSLFLNAPQGDLKFQHISLKRSYNILNRNKPGFDFECLVFRYMFSNFGNITQSIVNFERKVKLKPFIFLLHNILFKIQEFKIIKLIGGSLNMNEFSWQLNIAFESLYTQRKNILKKSHSKNITELATISAGKGYK